MPGTFQWLQLSTAVQQLSQRLSDPNQDFWTYNELVTYVQMALRQYNCLVSYWKTDFNFTSSQLWNSLGSLTGSPRLRTVTDTYLYTDMENRLLEPATGGTWTGTVQFNISVLSQALQRRRDEMLQISACNDALLYPLNYTPNTTRNFLSDNAIDVPRVRCMSVQASTSGSASSGVYVITVASTTGIAQGQLVQGTGIGPWTTVSSIGSGTITVSIATTGAVSGTLTFYQPTTLYRDDTIAQEFYEAPLYQQPSGTPNTFSLSSEPPLSFDVDIPPSVPGYYETIVLQSGTAFNPPSSTLVNIPDDWTWVLELGALADILGEESEATDRERSEYCRKRYQDGLKLFMGTPWIMLGRVNGVACNVDSLADTDRYSVGWDSDPLNFGPVVITAGMDFVATPVGSSIGLTVLGNAPVPVNPDDYVQVLRSDWDTVLDLAQVWATFKQGGDEWQQSLEIEARAIKACALENTRIQSLGCFTDILYQRGQAMDRAQNRYNMAKTASAS